MVVKYIAFALLIAPVLAQVPPASPVITGPQIIIYGDSVTLNCTVTRGLPTPTVTWFHNNIVIDDTSFVNGSTVTNTYSFQASNDQHQEVFECQTENGVLQNPLTTTKFVEVYRSPQQPVLTGPTSVVPGTTTTWTCRSAGAYAQHTMTMRIGNTQFNNSQFTTNTQYIASDDSYTVVGNLTFTPTTANNGQTLYCDYRHIDLSGNIPQTVSLLLSVTSLSVTAPNMFYYPTKTETVTLICIVTTGNPTQIRWYKDNQLLTLTGRFSGGTASGPALTIKSVVMSDAGSYICEATDGSAIVRTTNIQLSPIDGSDCINQSTINLRDDQWSASTEYGSSIAQEGNLNGVGWLASSNNQFQYLKIDLEGVWQITRVLFRRVNDGLYRWHTRTLRVLYSENNFEWIPYTSRLSSDVFGEKFESAGLDTNITFDPPIETRYIVFNPTDFSGYPSLKVELYGCHLKDQTKSVTQFSNDVETNTAWIPSQSPVIINKTIDIRPSVTLEIHAGVSVIFTKPDAGIHIFGSLITKGIPGLTAMFSSDYPVTSLKNKWKGLELKPGGSLHISHSVIRQGDICVQGISEDIEINFSTFYSCNSALRVSEGINLTVTNEESIPETAFKIRNSEFIYNQYGIQFLGTTENPSFFIKKCNISLSSGYGIQIGNWYNRALSDVLSRLYIDMSSIERNSNHGIYSGSRGLASIFVNNTVIKGHTGSIGIYSYRQSGHTSFAENITIMNSELSNNRQQSVYMISYSYYGGYSFLKITNTTFESNFHRSVDVYHNGDVSISIVGNSFQNSLGSSTAIELRKLGLQSDVKIIENTFRASHTVISVNGQYSIIPISIQGNVFDNITQVSINSKSSLITISNAKLNFTRNTVQNCLMYSLIDIKDGVEHIFSENKFIDNLLTPCYINVESKFSRTHTILASYNFWGDTNTDTIKSKICDFFVDTRLALVKVEQFYIDITMLSTLNISNDFKSVQQLDEKVYIIGGIINGSLSMLYPEGSIIVVNRSILILETGDVQISKASFNFSQHRGIRSYGKLEISYSDLQGKDLKWNGLHIHHNGLNLQNVTLRDVKICIEVLDSCDVNINNTTVWNTENLLQAEGLIGDLNIYFRNSNITVSNTMLRVGFWKSNSIVIRDYNSIFSSNIGQIFEISELSTQDSITNISFDLFGSNLNSYGTYSSYQINIDSCSGYLHSLIRNSTFDGTYAYAEHIYIRTQATNIEVAQNIFRMSEKSLNFDITCQWSSQLNTVLEHVEKNVNILNNSFNGLSSGYDFYIDIQTSYIHFFHLYDNNFTHSPLAINRYGISFSLVSYSIRHFLDIKGNYFSSGKKNAVYIYGYVGLTFLIENTFQYGMDCVKIDIRNSDYNITISDNVFVDNYGSTAILDLFQPNGNVPPILLSRNIFQNNLNTVLLFRSPNISISHNSFENPNATYNIKVNSAGWYQNEIVNASLNFWGTTNLKEIGQKIYDKSYDDTLLDVMFRPYLGSRNVSDIQNEEPPFISISGEIGGRVNGEITLTADKSQYQVTANIEVGESDTLTLEPGVTLLFNKDLGINVEGTLIVNGSSEMPILMLEKVHGEAWRGISIDTAEGIHPTTIRYLQVTGTIEGIVLKRNYAEMKNISSTYSKGHGFTINQQQKSGNISRSIFEELVAANNNKNGIQIISADKITVTNILISHCCVYQNGESGFNIQANISIDIDNCVIKENTQCGVYVEQSKGGDVFLKSSTLSENRLYAVEVITSNTISMESCILKENGPYKTYQYGTCKISHTELPNSGFNVTFRNNTFFSNPKLYGIYIYNQHTSGSLTFIMKFNRFSFERRVLYLDPYYRYEYAAKIDISHNIFNNNTESSEALIKLVLSDDDFVDLVENTFINNTAKDILTISSNPYARSVSKIEIRIFDNIFKDNIFTDSCLNLKSYHVISVNRNTFMNPQTTGKCELQAPSFDESYSIDATHNFWGSNNMSDIIEKVCGFEKTMEKSYVYYLPFSTSGEKDDFVASAQDDFEVQNVFGGEITGTFTINYKKEATRISRSIFVRTNASLNIENGIKMHFDEKRGIYIQGSLNVDDGESRSLFTNGSVASIWYGMVISTKNTGNVKLHDAYISNTEIGIQSKDKFLNLKNITIYNSSGACLSMLSGAEGNFDLEGSLFNNCLNHGLFLSKYVNASFTGLDISSSYEGIQLITDQTGHLTLHNIRIKTSSMFAVHVEFNHGTNAGNITIHDIEVIDSQTGFQLIVDNYYTHNSIEIRDNSFYNISRYAMQISMPDYHRYHYQNGGTRFVDIGYNTFTSTCGVTLDTWDSVNVSFHDNDFTGSSCSTVDKCFLSILVDGFRDIPHHVFDISTNKFMGINSYCVIELKSHSYFSYHKGTMQFNSFLLNKVSRGVVVLDTSYFNISQNIFDNHDSTFDLYTTGSGDDTINATQNWFGNMTLSLVYDRIFDRRLDPSLMSVNITPLLLEWTLDCSLVNNCSNQGQCVSPNRCRCFSGWTGKNCTEYDCSDANHCYGNGQCIGPNKCDCHPGWEGDTCIVASCFDVKNCSGHGICLRPGVCKCASKFTGEDCSHCVPLHWGSLCSQCPDCQHGTCNLTTGMCDCNGINWSDVLCDKCSETFYGPDCLPLMMALQVVPNQGSDKGGTVVHVWGHNFPEVIGHVYICKFGQESVNGTWIAWNHVTCTAPQHEEGRVFLEVSPNGTHFTSTKIPFTYYATCPPGACGSDHQPPNGQCLFGGCSCNLPWIGENCTIELLAPRIMTPEESQSVVEGTKYIYGLNLSQGSLPVRWELNQYPVGMTIDERTGQVEWGFTISNLTHHMITATVTNVIGKDVVSWQLFVSISYSASVIRIEPDGILPAPTTVTIIGTVTFNSSVQPKVVPVDIRVISSYSKRIRVLPALTDPLSPSSFSATYYPYPDDVGIISAIASHPVESSRNGAFNWTVLGMRCQPYYVSWDAVIENNTVVFKNVTSLVNVGEQPIFNISSRVDGISGTYFQSSKMSSSVKNIFLDSLEAFETYTFDFIVTEARPLRGQIYIIFSTPYGTETRLQVNMQFSINKPLLVFTPATLTDNIIRGTQKILDVSVHNEGEVSATNVTVSLPIESRLSLVSFAIVGSLNNNENNDGITIAPNEVAMMSLAVTSDSNDGLGEMSGTILLKTDLTTASISYRFYITSILKLNLTITVTDEYTYFASGAPLVSGAEVRLINPGRQYSETRYTTNEKGYVMFDGIQEDRYTLYVQAEGHSSYSAVIIASPDRNEQEVFMPRIAVKYTWTVTPTTVQDKYVVTLDSTFETNVPMPVVTVDPVTVNTIPYELGEEDTMEFTITNHGLIRVDNVRFAFPSNHPYLKFNMTVGEIGSLSANTSIKVPILVTLQNTRKKRSLSCFVCGLAVLYDYVCGPSKQTKKLDIPDTKQYPGRPPLPFCGSCSGGLGDSGVDPVGTGRIFYIEGPIIEIDPWPASSTTYNPVIPLSCDCVKTMIKNCVFGSYFGCTNGIESLAKSVSGDNTGGNLFTRSLDVVVALIDTFFGCVAPVLGFAGKIISAVYSAVRCLVDVHISCDNGGRRRRDVSSEVVNNLLDAAKPVDNFLSMMQQILNDENMYDVDTSWYRAFKPVVSDESPLGIQLTSDELSKVLSAINDETQKVTLNKFLERWNNTATAWKDGTLNSLTDTADVINFQKLDPGIQQYIDDHNNAKTKGFNSIFDVYDHATETYKTAEQETQSGSSESVCAKVRVRIVQDLVLTRDAFNARLEMENGETSALENIKVEIRITQTFGNGESAKDTFSIGKPSLIGISGVDGEGTLEKDFSGSAEWLMIPYSTAAPLEDTLYDVGGQLSYSVGGSNFSVPLLPDIITVKPNPSLVVHYFHEKYVRGDDPLTANIEPIIPFSLAVTVMNDGFGTAQALRISSAQPEIIENEKGLLITFKILGAKLGNEQIAPSLSVDFGDIHSFETKTATWLLTSTLKGTFYNYTATFENINPLGDPQLSLFDELGYHELVHLVRINTENESDDVDDFLVNDIVDREAMPDRLYNSQNGSDVYDVYIGNITQLYTSSYVRSQHKVYTVVHLKVIANTSIWTYTRMENNITSSNPFDRQNLLQCESSLSRKLLIEKNVWQTTHILDKFFLHIFDFIPSNETAEEGVEVTYDITFGPRNMYAPVFNMPSYSQTVPFDASIGSVILTLSGHDIDDDQMSFQIVDEDIKPVFAIDETIGSIKTKVLLNSTTVFKFKVIIVDHGIPPMSSMTNITVSVTDYTISSVSSTDTASTVSTPLTSYITSYTTISAESSAARETVGSETSTRSREMYSSESQATPSITRGYTTESSIPAGQTNDKYTTSTDSAKHSTVKVENKCNSTSLACDLVNGGCTINSTENAFCFCNAGYEFTNPGVNYTCIDEDECVSKSHSCNQRCINTAGGYLCSCEDGFELTGNTTCQNIDECTLLINNCEQICVDTIGSFKCSCRDGFVLNSDQSSCNRDYNPCANKNMNCSYGCVLENNEPVCYCPENYELSKDDNQTCSVVYISVEISLTTAYPYSSNLADPSTDEFKHARIDIKVALYYRYTNIPGFLSLTVISFSFGSTVVQYTVVFNQSLSDSLIMETASVTNNIRQIIVLDKSYGVTGETFVNYQTKNQEPLTCTLCGANHTCVILSKNTYECRPPLSKLESRSLFIEATLRKTFNQNYGNKLHLDYAAYEEEVEQAFATEMSGVEDIQYLNVTNLRNHTEGVITSLVMIFNTVANKTLQYDKVLSILVKIETEDRSCVDIVDTCIAVNGSITLGNTTTALEPVICSTCSLTQQCIQDNQISGYQCVNQPTTEQTASSTSERTTTTVQSKSSSDLLLGLGIGLPVAITAFMIFSTIMICMFCRCKKRKSEPIVQGQSEDDNWQIRQAFGRKDSSLRGTKSLVGFYNEVAY